MQHNQPIESQENHIRFEWKALAELEQLDLRPKDFKQLIKVWAKQPMSKFFYSSIRQG